jgi:FemAB-related protein (PEP-CTERM system-associated)
MQTELLDCQTASVPANERSAALTVSVRDDGPWDLPDCDCRIIAGYGSDPRWMPVLKEGLQQRPMRIESRRDGRLVGMLPLSLVESRLFGRFLVSLPYVNSAGVIASDAAASRSLIDRAVGFADENSVRYLELRHETRFEHESFNFQRTDKVHMRRELPNCVAELRDSLKAKVRNQVKKGESFPLDVVWGRDELLPGFYRVFSRNMRDLGTPVYGRRLFSAILAGFGDDAELCVVRQDERPIAAALLIHSDGVTQVPSASSLRTFKHLNANMLLYWHLLARAVERGSRVFDFGRSSEGSGPHRFKMQWGAQPHPAVWQYCVREGDANAMRPESAVNQRLIRLWRRLPVWLANCLGPRIVRGIP